MSQWENKSGVTTATGGGSARLDALFGCLASTDRRRLLGILYERTPAALTGRDLATYFVPGCHENSAEQASDEEIRQVRLELHHAHLPKLEAAGLISRDAARDTVAITDHPAFEDSGVVAVITGEGEAEADSLDALFLALADPRRRAILDVLSHQFGPIHTETLARELGADERNVAESDVSPDTVEEIRTGLTHVHLPHLSAAGVIEYDGDEQRVAYEGHPELRVPWMHSVLEPGFRPSLTGDDDPNGVGELRGRADVVSFGQSLCDRAVEELFCMFTDTDLLEAGCFTRIEQASRRGVDVYLGTRDPTVRAFVRENAPEVVLWEPDTDWLNVPTAGGRVGRLLLVDREAVMLGTLLGETTDGVAEERAIIGEGADNTLVTVLCQLLTPHLQQFDDDTVDVESGLPL